MSAASATMWSCPRLTATTAPASGRAAQSTCFSPPAPSLLQVLHLLAELLDHGLELQPDIGQFQVVRLRAQCIRFAIELLGEKVELAPDRAAAGDQLVGLRDMG